MWLSIWAAVTLVWIKFIYLSQSCVCHQCHVSSCLNSGLWRLPRFIMYASTYFITCFLLETNRWNKMNNRLHQLKYFWTVASLSPCFSNTSLPRSTSIRRMPQSTGGILQIVRDIVSLLLGADMTCQRGFWFISVHLVAFCVLACLLLLSIRLHYVQRKVNLNGSKHECHSAIVRSRNDLII